MLKIRLQFLLREGGFYVLLRSYIYANVNIVMYVVLDNWQLQSSWQQMQSSQVNVTSQVSCLTEELSVIQTAKDQVFCHIPCD